ncbi:hypothetical protein ID144_19880 [Pseudomonas sp. JM0905a]|uniref:hypothetical protein n=1 Tax=Pseudomonas sp. JM0905a TaxID=2772484 RepID=UPI00168588C6|nr:hypothetical protein [Pseudomonas sp. JM0905a]MBD2839301.1 hypothetical protein [Pseudomonas sp. JM0905a]
MRILKLLILLLACATSGQLLAQQPWTSTSSSGETLLAWNGGGHGGGRHFNGHRHSYGHRHFYGHRGYYRHDPRVIYVPRYYDSYYMGYRPYYYQRYGSPRIVIQYYDPRRGIFVGSDFGGY